ncbi:MAG: hypothetical protein HY553_13945 [Elusimicrobia bacterium]|nr:hypothetical protein [Elusimicrobiota bacterium]
MITRKDEERGLEFTVSPETGGELSSLRVRRGDAWVQALFRAEDFDRRPRDLWRGRCPWLFPAVGRNYLPDQLSRVRVTRADEHLGSWEWGGRPYAMPIHGFALGKVWEPLASGPAEAACRLESGPQSRLFYPFDFELVARYGFLDDGVFARLEVAASDQNEAEMPFSVGNHLTLALPFGSATAPADCTLRTPARESWDLDAQNLLAGTTRAAGLAEPLALGLGPALLNAVLGGFEWEDSWVEVSDPASFSVRVSQREIVETAVPFTAPEHYRFVFWGDLKAGFFCPEPWYGGPNSLNEKRGIVRLPPGARFSWELRVQLR